MNAIFVLIWVACAALGYAVGHSKGRAAQGLVLGLLLGLIGIIIIACLKPKPAVTPFNQAAPGYGMPGAVPPMSPPVAGQWLQDPSGRHQNRWWTGTAWTDHVADNGVTSTDSASTPPQAGPHPPR
jgi:hypothetical protein